MRDHGRIALCGAISEYERHEPAPGPDNLLEAVARRLTLRGFIVFDHEDLRADYRRRATRWLTDGSLTDAHTVVDGLDRAVDAFLGLAEGKNTGMMLVRLAPLTT